MTPTYLTSAWGTADLLIDGGGDDTLNLTLITDDLTVTLDSGTGLTVTDGVEHPDARGQLDRTPARRQRQRPVRLP